MLFPPAAWAKSQSCGRAGVQRNEDYS
jgi:hypothetical protein